MSVQTELAPLDVTVADLPPVRHLYPPPYDRAWCGQRRENDALFEGVAYTGYQRKRWCRTCKAREDEKGQPW